MKDFDLAKARAALKKMAQGGYNGAERDAVGMLAGVVSDLIEQLDATQDQVGFLTRKLQKQADSLAPIAYETQERRPVPFKDFLPEGPEHHHTGDSGPCWDKDCFDSAESEQRPERAAA